jgi:hypothetical protein
LIRGFLCRELVQIVHPLLEFITNLGMIKDMASLGALHEVEKSTHQSRYFENVPK